MSYERFPAGMDWQRVAVVYDATAVPIAAGAGTALWTPPYPGLVRALTCNDDSGSALVGNGGATTLSIGVDNQATNFLAATAIAAFATALQGWGNGGPSTGSATDAAQDSGVVVAPAGSVPGRAGISRTIRGFANAGTITGTLHVRFEFRAFAGGSF